MSCVYRVLSLSLLACSGCHRDEVCVELPSEVSEDDETEFGSAEAMLQAVTGELRAMDQEDVYDVSVTSGPGNPVLWEVVCRTETKVGRRGNFTVRPQPRLAAPIQVSIAGATGVLEVQGEAWGLPFAEPMWLAELPVSVSHPEDGELAVDDVRARVGWKWSYGGVEVDSVFAEVSQESGQPVVWVDAQWVDDQ